MWEWREPFDSLLWLAAGGMTGTLARMGLVELFRCYSTAVSGAACRSLDDGALFLVLAPNMCGCFVAGLLSTPAAAGVAADERYGLHALAALPPAHRTQKLVRLHVGLRTGFCGALTTWASWNQEMVARAVHGDWARALLGLLFGVQLSLASLAVGQHVAAGLWHAHVHPRRRVDACDVAEPEQGGLTTIAGERPPLPALSHPPAARLWSGDVAAAVVLAAAVAGCVTGLAQSADATARVVCLAALCSPFGVIARWQLARLNGTLGAAPWLPLGTLSANVAACLFDAALAAGYDRSQLSRGAVWGGVLNAAFQAGIGGGLSTVSTAVVETSLLFSVIGARWRGYMYLLVTLVLSYAPALAIYGGATHGTRRRAVVALAQPASHVRLFGGLAAETLGSFDVARGDPPTQNAGVKLRVGVVPGNPGVAAYYADFVEALQLELGPSAAVCALGLLGHSREPLHARTFDLEEQVAHVVRFVDDASADADAPPLVLVGHSIGAWLALRALQKRPERVQCVAGLFPFLQNNSESRLQKVLAAAVKLRPLVWLVAQTMTLLALLPVRWRRTLLGPVLRGVGGLEDDAVAVTCDWLRAASVQNTCTLGAAEFAALAGEPDWAALQERAARISFFYGGSEDIWGPPAHAAAVRRNAPGVTVVEDDTHGHMFCTTREGSLYVAQEAAQLLRAMMASRATPAAAR